MHTSHARLVVFALLFVRCTSALFFRRDEGDDEEILSIPVRSFGDQLYTVHVTMGSGTGTTPQWFNFSLANTHAYTAVAGLGCTSCSSATKRYNSSLSASYRAPPANASTVSFDYNGKTVSGALATENCSLMEQDGDWWWYNDQKVLVADSGTDSSAFSSSVGLAGFGQSNVPDPKDSIVGQYLAVDDEEAFTFGFALSGADSKGTDDAPLNGDSSGGYMHIHKANPEFYTGTIATTAVVGSTVMNNLQSLPTQLGSYDWSVQIQSFVLKTPQAEVTGGFGTYATLEMAYPYIILPQGLANQFYAKISGAQQYVVTTNAVTTSGLPVYQDLHALSWSIPCGNSGVIFYVNFNGVSIPVQSSDLFTSIGGLCVGNVKAWADPNIQTAILGSTFFRNAYVVFTAQKDATQSTVGIANRLIAGQGKNSANKGVIIGATVGGVVVLLILAGVIFFFARRWRRQARSPPSAAFAAPTIVGTTEYLDRDKSPAPSSFFGLGSKDKFQHGTNYAAEPWMAPASTVEGGKDEIVVTPWTPTAPGEQAFLSPTGTAVSLPYTPNPQQRTSSTGSHHQPAPRTSTMYSTASTSSVPPPAMSGYAYSPAGTSSAPVSATSTYFVQGMMPGSPVGGAAPAASLPHGAGSPTVPMVMAPRVPRPLPAEPGRS